MSFHVAPCEPASEHLNIVQVSPVNSDPVGVSPDIMYHGFKCTGFCEWDRSFEKTPEQSRPAAAFKLCDGIPDAFESGDWMLGPYPIGRFEVVSASDSDVTVKFRGYVPASVVMEEIARTINNPHFFTEPGGFPDDLRALYARRAY